MLTASYEPSIAVVREWIEEVQIRGGVRRGGHRWEQWRIRFRDIDDRNHQRARSRKSPSELDVSKRLLVIDDTADPEECTRLRLCLCRGSERYSLNETRQTQQPA